jgi:aromatic-L-amino-acid/L-tryptophan decarboxylase
MVSQLLVPLRESMRTRPDGETPLKENERSERMSGRGTADEHTPAPAAGGSLDPQDWTGLREQAHHMLDDMLGYMETMREFPVWQVIPDEVRARFREDLPAQPTPLAQVHAEFMGSILPFAARNAHPGFLGWVQGGGTAVGMLAEMLAAGLNANVGGRDQIPLEVENQVTHWMRTLFNFPPAANGLFVTGTSMANLLAVLIARDARLGPVVRRRGIASCAQKPTAYASVAVHGSIGRALDFAGLGSEALRLIGTDRRQRIDLAALEQAICADRSQGFTPFLLVGTAGSVDTGAIDDLDGMAELAARHRLWFHVDGAYGALAILVAELAPRLNGIERADSLAFDFHKWAQVPYDAGFILVRDGVRQQQAFASSCAYLMREQRGMSAGSPWPCDLGPDLSRGFRALKTWATLKVYGMNAIGTVILRSCELARYLEGRIRSSTELELMAPVELNIVCFRYRFDQDELADQLNRRIVIQLQEAGAVAPSATTIGGRLSIRAAIVNHRTSQAEMDSLVAATLAAGRALRPAEQPKWQPWLERDSRIQRLDVQLDQAGDLQKGVAVALHFERATLLAEMGRHLEARSDHLTVLELEPAHRLNLFGLGRLLVSMGQRKAAQMVYAEGVKYYPGDVSLLVNLGSVLLETDHPAEARSHYETALRIDPEFPQAHGGMYYALTRLGEPELAKLHQEKAFAQKALFPSPFRGDAEPIPVLLLVSSTGGNTPVEKLIDDRVFQTYVVVADFYDTKTPLPPHRLVINGIGDCDAAARALLAAEALLAFTSAPVLNHPTAVRATGRCENASRLRKVPGIKTPATVTFPYALLAGKDGASALARCGFTFPLLLRTPGFHGGQHFVRVEAVAALADGVAELRESGGSTAEVMAIEFLDARGADGSARKYRVMMVGGRLYPLHLAISKEWKIHYFSAEMRDRAEHRAEEAKFLADMPGVLGANVMAALERLLAALGLDYGGIDFGLNQRGEILLFEANATMVVEQPGADQRWDYRRAAVERIHAAVRDLLTTSAGTAPHHMAGADLSSAAAP